MQIYYNIDNLPIFILLTNTHFSIYFLFKIKFLECLIAQAFNFLFIDFKISINTFNKLNKKPNKQMKPFLLTQHPFKRGYSGNSFTISKKMLYAIGLFFSITIFSSNLFAQEVSETEYKGWLFVGESKNHVDVSARIVKCSEASAAQVHLFIFNEGSESNDIRFSITVTDVESSKSFTTDINHKVERAMMLRALCDNDKSLNDLKINLPAGYNPNNLTISINFN